MAKLQYCSPSGHLDTIVITALMTLALTLATGCGDDAPTGGTTRTDTGSDGGQDAGVDIGDGDTNRDASSDTPLDSPEDSGEDTGEDTSDGGGDDADDADVPGPMCDCDADEVCVTNEFTGGTCYPRDCGGEQCDAGEVCYLDTCTATACAGSDCGGYPNVCRGGICIVANCNDPDVGCPGTMECVDDACSEPCGGPNDCTPQACIDGFCRFCASDDECGNGFLCDAERCVADCNLDPSRCTGGQICDGDSGRCQDPCVDNGTCGPGEVCEVDSGECIDRCNTDPDDCGADDYCDAVTGLCVPRCSSTAECASPNVCDVDTGVCIPPCSSDPECDDGEICGPGGECVPPECTTVGTQGECSDGEICLDMRCIDPAPPFYGQMCGGAEKMSSNLYEAVGIVGPVEPVGSRPASTNYVLEPGTITILRESD